jgi:hypothetical protein
MRKRWVTPLLALALVASLLLHVTAAFGDLIWDWWSHDSQPDDTPLKATQRKLRSQTLDSATGKPTGLAGVTPADHLLVHLGLPSTHPVHASVATRVPPSDPHRPTPAHATKALVPTPPTPSAPAIAAADKPPEPPAPSQLPNVMPVSRDAPAAPALPVTSEPPGNTAQPAVTARPVLSNPFPHRATINYLLNGFAPLEAKWQVDGNHYRLSLNIGMLGKASSEGDIDQHGLRPLRYQQFRVNESQPRYQVDFDWASHTVRVGEPGKQKEELLQPGAVDVFSAGYQFALLGDQQPGFDIQVLTGRASYIVSFALKGEAALTLSGITVPTLVLGGTKDSRSFDYYLAPDWHNLPVRIRYSDGDKSYDLVATQVIVDDQVVLARRTHRANDR